METLRILATLNQITYRDWSFHYDETTRECNARFIVPDALTGKRVEMSTRKWRISQHATKSDAVSSSMNK